jgi:RNA polymerase sigma factor (sigma-70 family)
LANERSDTYEEKVRQLLAEVRTGDGRAFESLIEAVGGELRKLSAYRLKKQGRYTLHTSTLVKEVVVDLLRIVNQRAHTFPESKEHFLALATRMMICTLTDHARKRKMVVVPLHEELTKPGVAAAISKDPGPLHSWSSRDIETLLAVEQALNHIEKADSRFGPRRRAALELYLFGGMKYVEIAKELGTSEDIARNDCRLGLARLRRLLAMPETSTSAMETDLR